MLLVRPLGKEQLREKRKRQNPAACNHKQGGRGGEAASSTNGDFCFFPCVSLFLAPAGLARSQQLARGAHAAPAVSASISVSLSVVRGAAFELPVGRYPCCVWVLGGRCEGIMFGASSRETCSSLLTMGGAGKIRCSSICVRARLARTLKKICACSFGGRASGHKLENLSAPSVDTVLFHWWPFCISWQEIGVLRKRVNTVWTLHSNTGIFVDAIGRSQVLCIFCCCGPDL